MKKHSRLLFVCIAVFSFFVCSGFQKDGGLKEITKPYLGVYTCEKVQLADSNYLRYFKKITIELKADETFSLSAQPKLGRKISAGGGYVYDEEENCFLLKTENKKNLSDGRMSIEKGKLYIRARYGKKLLIAVFSR